MVIRFPLWIVPWMLVNGLSRRSASKRHYWKPVVWPKHHYCLRKARRMGERPKCQTVKARHASGLVLSCWGERFAPTLAHLTASFPPIFLPLLMVIISHFLIAFQTQSMIQRRPLYNGWIRPLVTIMSFHNSWHFSAVNMDSLEIHLFIKIWLENRH